MGKSVVSCFFRHTVCYYVLLQSTREESTFAADIKFVV